MFPLEETRQSTQGISLYYFFKLYVNLKLSQPLKNAEKYSPFSPSTPTPSNFLYFNPIYPHSVRVCTNMKSYHKKHSASCYYHLIKHFGDISISIHAN